MSGHSEPFWWLSRVADFSFAVIIRGPEAVNPVKVPYMNVVSGDMSHRNPCNEACVLSSCVSLFYI